MEEERERSSLVDNQACRNCGAALTDEYCAHCGQRRFEDDSRRLRHLVGEAFSTITNLDSRFWRTFGALVFRPGRLSRDYIDGRRSRWLAPVTVLLLVNVFYFIAPALTDLNLPFFNQVPGELALASFEGRATLTEASRAEMSQWRGQFHSFLTAGLVKERVERRNAEHRARSDGARGYTVADYAEHYDAASSEVSKVLIFLHAPFMALGLMALFWRRGLFFADHMVTALHLFAFMVLLTQILVGPLGLLSRQFGGDWFADAHRWLLPLSLLLMYVYMLVALRVVYRTPYWWAMLASALMFLVIAFSHLLVYRPVQFLIVFALT